MGILSDIGAVFGVQRIKRGGTAELSISQIVNLIINISDAQKNLSPEEAAQVYDLFKVMRKCKTKLPMDMDGYCDTAVKIIREFDKIAPYEKYSGGNEMEFSFMMDDIRGENYKEICSLKKEISQMELVLEEHDEAFFKNKKILDEAFTDEDLKRMVSAGEFPADCVSEYIEQRNNLALFVGSAPKIRETTVGFIADLKEQLAELESEASSVGELSHKMLTPFQRAKMAAGKEIVDYCEANLDQPVHVVTRYLEKQVATAKLDRDVADILIDVYSQIMLDRCRERDQPLSDTKFNGTGDRAKHFFLITGITLLLLIMIGLLQELFK